MELVSLIEALSKPAAYPHPVEAIEVHQTHISVVFLAGPFAYKIKKPVNLGFLDFSTLEKRKHYCEQEVCLNRRLAPQVYLGVVPITSESEAQVRARSDCLACASGSRVLRFGGSGQIVEWAVHMKRLPSEATLENRLLRDKVNAGQIRALAKRIAAFHRAAQSSERIA